MAALVPDLAALAQALCEVCRGSGRYEPACTLCHISDTDHDCPPPRDCDHSAAAGTVNALAADGVIVSPAELLASLPHDDSVVRRAAAAVYGDGTEEEWLRTVDGSPNSAAYHYARCALAAVAIGHNGS